MDGFSLAEQIQKDRALSATPIVFLTSTAAAGEEPRWRELRVAGYLTKPLLPSDLLQMLRAVLGKKAPASKSSGSHRVSSQRNSRQLRVLLAEDSPVGRKVAGLLLERLGHRVVAVENGRQVLATLDSEAFDVLLIDVHMPVMDGLQASSAIREREKNSSEHLPIIALTALAMKGDRERCLAAGMDAYLTKPIEPKTLYETLERFCSTASLPQASPQTASDTVCDVDALLERVGGSPELLSEIVDLFFEDREKMMGDIRESLALSDSVAVKRAAHLLTGTLGTLGAKAASRAALRLETLGREGDLDQAGNAFSALQREMERLEPELTGLAKESVSRRSEP